MHWHYLSPSLYLCSLPLLCLCIILSLAVAHNAPHSHPPPSHIHVEHKQAAVWIKHLRQCTRWAPLECQDEHWYSDRGLWPHTVSVCQCVCVCVTLYLTLYHIEQRGLSHLFSFMFYCQRGEAFFSAKALPFWQRKVSLRLLFPHTLSYAFLVSPSVLSLPFSYLIWFFSTCCFQLVVCVKIVFLLYPPPLLPLFYSLAFIFQLLSNFFSSFVFDLFAFCPSVVFHL